MVTYRSYLKLKIYFRISKLAQRSLHQSHLPKHTQRPKARKAQQTSDSRRWRQTVSA